VIQNFFEFKIGVFQVLRINKLQMQLKSPKNEPISTVNLNLIEKKGGEQNNVDKSHYR
jgi:hypothetical protein